ncbi:hypothetical protein KP509_33G036700 [Ceratopteris richardii]|uniref:Uncharacterized protein n=1 Tax=Ceratopteris richardii TaxID=49495 RepID=A0A8T2QNR5_CERRI|nr:hypothetical protein KP509_33G036700 [Ceratopteris richardii]
MKPKKKNYNAFFGVYVGDSLAPLMEGPIPENDEDETKTESSWLSFKPWAKGGKKRSDPRLLLDVLGCPLAPETSSALYIIHQYIAATGATKLQTSVHNSYTMGKVKMVITEYETATKISKTPLKSAENGWFVLWQMMPHKWYIELALGGSMIQAGSNGKLAWTYTPWFGACAVRGPVRPLRRVLQGLDPMATASIFVNAQCIGEKKIGDEDCFVLKVSADQSIFNHGDEAEIIRHVLFGYFSQRTGWLIYLEDSQLIRIQVADSEVVYLETRIESSLTDYRDVEGVSLAHGGHSVVTLFKFRDEAMNHVRTRMEETWSIEEVAFDVPGLSTEFFIPPSDVSLNNAKEMAFLFADNDKCLSLSGFDQLP